VGFVVTVFSSSESESEGEKLILVSTFLLLVVEEKWRRMVLLKLREFEENSEVENNLEHWRRLVLDLKVEMKAREIVYEAID
jgi:hypothetical protein